jgi:hypothetical protein
LSTQGCFKDLSGQTFGRLYVSFPAGCDTHGDMRFYCICECGELRVVAGFNLRSGHTSSCGCLQRLLASKTHTKHGHCYNATTSPTYTTWLCMIQRCTNPNQKFFRNYGGRGIKVCERWMTFENFLSDMGERPIGTTIDRENNDLGYFKENCRWATRKEQQNNLRVHSPLLKAA